jgi:large subunit ribosomal protein L23
VLTEKSLGEAKKGQFTFLVDRLMNKLEIKALIEKAFDVHVLKVRTQNLKGGVKKVRGRKVTKKAAKKTTVTLKAGEKIGIFDEKTK